MDKFSSHMENEHGAYFDHEFILATCFMDAEEKEAVKVVIDAKDIEDEDDTDMEGGGTVVKMEYGIIKEERKEDHSNIANKLENVSKTSEGPSNTCVACAKCEQRFEKTEHLRIHMKVIHTGATPEKKTEFYCEKCDQYYCRKDALRIHMSRRHKGEDDLVQRTHSIVTDVQEETKVFGPEFNETKSRKTGNELECDYCHKTFTRKNNLNHHKKMKHENISETMRKSLTTPFHCTLCGKSFTRKDNLRYHKHNVHGTGETEDMLSCRICDKNFTRRDNLNKHLRTLHNREPYQCKDCNFSTSLQDRLNQHMEREHKSPPSPKPSSPLPILQNVNDARPTMEGPFRPTSPMDIIKDMWKTKNMLEDSIQHISPQNLDGPQSVVIDDVKAMWRVKKGLEEVEITLDETDEQEESTPNPSGEVLMEMKATDLKVDTERSKYFRMNSYALSTLDEYTSGTLADFIDCNDLPSGWKFRFCGPPKSPEKSTHFITPDMSVIKSRLGAIEWLRLTGLYTRDQLWSFATLLHVPEKRFDRLF